jgi:hypothetical protein
MILILLIPAGIMGAIGLIILGMVTRASETETTWRDIT